MRIPGTRSLFGPRSLLLAAGTAAGIALVAATATLGVLFGRAADDELREDLDGALAAQRELGARDASIASLEGRVAELERALSVSEQQLALREDELAGLGDALSTALAADGELADLKTRFLGLEAENEALREERDDLAERWSRLVPIDAAELSNDPLYLDQSIAEVAVTRPLCTGSMEPTITCDDLLVLYEPQSITDLDVGDVIYFRKPSPDCSSTLDGRYTLHRIIDVISNSEGIWFQTKGDAFYYPDACLVPADSVEYKLLTTVRNARVGS